MLIILALQIIASIQIIVNSLGWQHGINAGVIYPQIGSIQPGYIWLTLWIAVGLLFLLYKKKKQDSRANYVIVIGIGSKKIKAFESSSHEEATTKLDNLAKHM
jgi:lipoprotein signal peptidase